MRRLSPVSRPEAGIVFSERPSVRATRNAVWQVKATLVPNAGQWYCWYNWHMTEREQDDHLARLLLDERRVRKELSCLASRSRQIHDALVPVLHALSQPYGLDFTEVRRLYSGAAGQDVGALLKDIEQAVKRLSVLQAEIKSIEDPAER